MKDYWFFVYATAPNCPIIARGIFPPEMLTEAFEFAAEFSGHRTVRKATWKFGKIPSYEETLPV